MRKDDKSLLSVTSDIVFFKKSGLIARNNSFTIFLFLIFDAYLNVKAI